MRLHIILCCFHSVLHSPLSHIILKINTNHTRELRLPSGGRKLIVGLIAFAVYISIIIV